MKAKLTDASPSPSPAILGLPLYDPSATRATSIHDVRPGQRLSVGPIELRIDGGDGPSAIAILE
jgi:hypothetical protein